MSVRFGIRGTAALQKALVAAGQRANQAAASALYIEAEKVMAASKQEAPVGVDGVLRASGFVNPPEVKGNGLRVTLGYGGAAKNYALTVHEGRGPGKKMPPPKALEPWVRKKLGVPAKEVEGVAFVVARSIGIKGTKPTKFLEKPLLRAAPGMAGRMATRIRRSLERK